MEKTLNVPLPTGIIGAWICTIFSLVAGVLWLRHVPSTIPQTIYDPNLMGYLLIVAGSLTLPPLMFGTLCSLTGHPAAATRISRIIKISIPLAFIVGWLLCRLTEIIVLFRSI